MKFLILCFAVLSRFQKSLNNVESQKKSQKSIEEFISGYYVLISEEYLYCIYKYKIH